MSIPKLPFIPTDVLHEIVGAIDDEEALKQCALAAKLFLLSSRRRLFADIHLQCSAQCERLYSVLVQNPHIQGYIKKLYIFNGVAVNFGSLLLAGLRCRCNAVRDDWTSRDGSALVPILQLSFHGLNSFSMLTRRTLVAWDGLSPSLQVALGNIMKLSSLTHVKLAFFTNTPVNFFPSHFRVKLLQLSENFFSVPEKDQGSQDTDQPLGLNAGALATPPQMHVEHLRWQAALLFIFCECLRGISF